MPQKSKIPDAGHAGSDMPPLPSPADFPTSPAPVWQTAQWNGFLVRTGWAKRWYRVSDGTGTDAGAWLELRSVGLGLDALFCVGWPSLSGDGPVADSDALRTLSREFVRIGRESGAVFVQYEPLSEIDLPDFSKGEYRHFLEKNTLLVDLRLSEDEILSQMKEKGRYNVRISQKRGVKVRFSDGNECDVRKFFELLSDTLNRDGFSGNSYGYYLDLVRMLTESGLGGLFVAEKDGVATAAAIATFSGGTATYYYGASTSDNALRRDMPAYALQWEMMLEGKRRGCVAYDFLGMAPPGSVGHPLEGVTDFKLKFGGVPKRWPDTRILMLRPWAYRLLVCARKLRGLLKR